MTSKYISAVQAQYAFTNYMLQTWSDRHHVEDILILLIGRQIIH